VAAKYIDAESLFAGAIRISKGSARSSKVSKLCAGLQQI
jgi:hypothetical protein